MKDDIKMVELGCGRTKTPGYIGVDRFPLPGVDVVADLNGQFPFDDDSVDVIYACHSLEHLDDLEHTMNEIYRICRHGAIVQILSPYYLTSLNMANLYHKCVFNEDTMRFFSGHTTEMISGEEWYCPHAVEWCVERSDNNDRTIELEILKMEYFYYKEYCGLSDERKLHARRTFQNVCDQIFYVLSVNKSGKPFSLDELKQYLERAKELEPPIISQLRARDERNALLNSRSVFTDLQEDLVQGMEKCKTDLREEFREIHRQTEILKDENRKLRMQLESMQGIYESRIKALINEVAAEGSSCEIQKNQIKDETFLNGLAQNHALLETERLTWSRCVPINSYVEYFIKGSGRHLHIYVCGSTDSKMEVEFVQNGQIAGQIIVSVSGEGQINMECPQLAGTYAVRFRAADSVSFIKLLRTEKTGFFKKKCLLAYYVS